MKREERTLTLKHRGFRYTKYTFSIDEDKDLMKMFQQQGEKLKKKLNPALARDASIIRDFKTKEIDAIGGIISEYLWQYELEIAIMQNNLDIVQFNPRFLDPYDQIDVQIIYEERTSKTIEVRLSYAYTGEEKWIIEIKHISRLRESELLYLDWMYKPFNAKIWLIIPNSKIYEKGFRSLRNIHFYISDQTDLKKIEMILNSDIK